MRIDPSDATAVKSALADELDHFAVWYHRCLPHERVVRKELLAAALVANQDRYGKSRDTSDER